MKSDDISYVEKAIVQLRGESPFLILKVRHPVINIYWRLE